MTSLPNGVFRVPEGNVVPRKKTHTPPYEDENSSTNGFLQGTQVGRSRQNPRRLLRTESQFDLFANMPQQTPREDEPHLLLSSRIPSQKLKKDNPTPPSSKGLSPLWCHETLLGKDWDDELFGRKRTQEAFGASM